MKKRIVSALLAGFLLVSATACGKQTAADAAQPVADPTQAYLDTVDVDYAYDLALKLEDIRSNETLGYRTAGSDAELATGDMLKAEMERIGLITRRSQVRVLSPQPESPDFLRNQDFFRIFASNILLAIFSDPNADPNGSG